MPYVQLWFNNRSVLSFDTDRVRQGSIVLWRHLTVPPRRWIFVESSPLAFQLCLMFACRAPFDCNDDPGDQRNVSVLSGLRYSVFQPFFYVQHSNTYLSGAFERLPWSLFEETMCLAQYFQLTQLEGLLHHCVMQNILYIVYDRHAYQIDNELSAAHSRTLFDMYFPGLTPAWKYERQLYETLRHSLKLYDRLVVLSDLMRDAFVRLRAKLFGTLGLSTGLVRLLSSRVVTVRTVAHSLRGLFEQPSVPVVVFRHLDFAAWMHIRLVHTEQEVPAPDPDSPPSPVIFHPDPDEVRAWRVVMGFVATDELTPPDGTTTGYLELDTLEREMIFVFAYLRSLDELNGISAFLSGREASRHYFTHIVDKIYRRRREGLAGRVDDLPVYRPLDAEIDSATNPFDDILPNPGEAEIVQGGSYSVNFDAAPHSP